jgi:hypothetical protein
MQKEKNINPQHCKPVTDLNNPPMLTFQTRTCGFR